MPKNLNAFSLGVSITKSTLGDFNRRSYAICATRWKSSGIGSWTMPSITFLTGSSLGGNGWKQASR